MCVETKQQQLCEHKDDERALTGTWVTEEVKKALEKDYKIIKIYEVSRSALKLNSQSLIFLLLLFI